MAVRRDEYQLNISFITDENRKFSKVVKDSQDLVGSLKKAAREGKDLTKVVNDIARAGEGISDIDLSQIAPADLLRRSRQLGAVLRQIPESAPQYAKLNAEYKRLNDRLAEIRLSQRGVAQAAITMRQRLAGAFAVFGGISLAGIAQGVLNLGKSIIRTTANFEAFEATLTNALGSRSAARAALRELADYAATTPFQLEELISSYNKLVNRGIQPTREELELLGDIAASQGKSFDQLTEALLDAVTGEFERLKEFGIRAKKEGDKVELTFKGVTKVVKNTENAITDALLEFGKLPGVLGSTASVSQTLQGKLSNLVDNFQQLLLAIGDSGLGRAVKNIVSGLSDLVGGLTGLIRKNESAADSVIALQTQFNLEIETLKRGELTQEKRIELINRMNSLYGGEYLANLLTEKSTIEEITAAQEAANEVFLQKINLIVSEERLKESLAKRRALDDADLDLQIRKTKALEEAAAAEERLRKQQLGVSGPQFGGTNVSENAALGRLDAIRAEILENERLKKELDDEIERRKNEIISAGGDLSKINAERNSAIAEQVNGSAPGGSGFSNDALDTRLKKINSFFELQQLLLDRALLEREVSESEHGQRVLELQRDQYLQQIDAYTDFNKSQSAAAERARNDLIQVEQTLNRTGTSVPLLGQRGTDQVERRGINAGLDRIAEDEERRLRILRQKFAEALIAEQDFEEQKLLNRRSALEDEIELLREGNAQEVALAAEKADELFEIDLELTSMRIANAEREKEAKRQIEETSVNAFKDLLSVSAQLLAKDEEARKKNFGVIKAFERGRILLAGIQEVQRIWAEVASLGPVAGPIVGGLQTAVAVGRTAVALQQLDNTQYAKGGIFGGKPHSQGGTMIWGSDGTVAEVERDEAFVIINKRSTDMMRRLSMINEAGGGVPFMESGGLLPVGNTTPRATAAQPVSGGGGNIDISALIDEFRQMRMDMSRFPREIRARVAYTDIEDAASDVNNVRSVSSV